MPTYDYLCDACGHEFEQWQSFHDNELTKCPACKKNQLRRLIGNGAAIVFKGSGFYETDYRAEQKSDKEPKKDDKATETAGTETKPAESTDKKPEAKPETKPEPQGGPSKTSHTPAPLRKKTTARSEAKSKPVKAAAKKKTATATKPKVKKPAKKKR